MPGDRGIDLHYPISTVNTTKKVLLGKIQPADIPGKLAVLDENGYSQAPFFWEADGGWYAPLTPSQCELLQQWFHGVEIVFAECGG